MTVKKKNVHSKVEKNMYAEAEFALGDIWATCENSIEQEYGKGYCREHPEFLGSMMQTLATILLTDTITDFIEKSK